MSRRDIRDFRDMGENSKLDIPEHARPLTHSSLHQRGLNVHQ
ncbi:hypothetical protein C8R31_10556 [Nitrosospira sp. Nsp2]|nr:hypothetical protein C8R31_10556 [Nitrosospira sp. Nsp2]